MAVAKVGQGQQPPRGREGDGERKVGGKWVLEVGGKKATLREFAGGQITLGGKVRKKGE